MRHALLMSLVLLAFCAAARAAAVPRGGSGRPDPAAAALSALEELQLVRVFAALPLASGEAARLLPSFEHVRARWLERERREAAELERLRPGLYGAWKAASAGGAPDGDAEHRYFDAERAAADRRRTFRKELASGLRGLLEQTLSGPRMDRVREAAAEAWEAQPAGVGRNPVLAALTVRGNGLNASAARTLDRARRLSPEEWEEERAAMVERIEGAVGEDRRERREELLPAALGRRLEERLALMERVRAMTEPEYREARERLAGGLARGLRQSLRERQANEEDQLYHFIIRHLLGDPGVRALRRRAGLPLPPLQETKPEADSLEALVRELHLFRALQQTGLDQQHGSLLLGEVEIWARKQVAMQATAEPTLVGFAERLRAALPAVNAEPSRTVPAEEECRRALRAHHETVEVAWAQVREGLAARILAVPPGVRDGLLAGAREELRRTLLLRTTAAEHEMVRDLLPELERLRNASTELYPRRREIIARRQAGALEPGTLRRADREGRQAPLPPLTDPAVHARVDRAVRILGQIRALPASTWQREKMEIAARLARERRASTADKAAEDELARFFAEHYLLEPASLAVLRDRFGPERRPQPQNYLD